MPVNVPQVRAVVAGVLVPGVVWVELESVAYYAAERFQIGFALGASESSTASFFAGLTKHDITIDAALSGFGFVNLIVGQIDNIRIDFFHKLAILSGRDLSARLIDHEASLTLVNQTSSQIATTVAEQFNLQPAVTATSTPVGQYYELDHTRTTLSLHSKMSTAWNLLTSLAQIEGFLLSVAGEALVFGPPPIGTVVPITVQNFIHLTIDTALTVPGAAIVRSWNTRQKSAVSFTAGQGSSSTIIRPNLSQAQAQNVAEMQLSVLGQHRVWLAGTMPADLTTKCGMQVGLTGTDSALDQVYTVSTVKRSLSNSKGFVQSIGAYANSP